LVAIAGPAAERLSAALLDAFTPDRFDQMLNYKLGRSRARISMAGNFESIVFDVIVAAGSEGWLDALVLGARQSRPNDVAIAAVAAELGLGPTVSPVLESIIHERAPMIDPVQWRRRLASIEGCICRIENEAHPSSPSLGTGFLIGADLCLTSFHIAEHLLDQSVRPEAMILRFDYTRDSAGREVYPGTIYRLASDWMVASFRYNAQEKSSVDATTLPARDELDAAVLRIAGSPGTQPIGRAEPGGQARGWLTHLSTFPPVPGDDLLILQHPQGSPLQLAFGKVLDLNANQTRVHHDVNTDHGSSGSPCFNLELDLIALHQAGDRTNNHWQLPARNRGIPILTIQSLLKECNPDQRFF
jgi:hypothetical protein